MTRITLPAFNMIILSVNIIMIFINGGNINKNKQIIEKLRLLEGAYKQAICEMQHQFTGQDTIHIVTITLDGSPVEFDCPRRT